MYGGSRSGLAGVRVTLAGLSTDEAAITERALRAAGAVVAVAPLTAPAIAATAPDLLICGCVAHGLLPDPWDVVDGLLACLAGTPVLIVAERAQASRLRRLRVSVAEVAYRPLDAAALLDACLRTCGSCGRS